MMFGDNKFKDEEGYVQASADALDNFINKESMEAVVDSIFRKAQNEKEYCNFYGDLCERIIRLELNLRALDLKKKFLKRSEFRSLLLEYCRSSFDRFFDKKHKNIEDEEESIKFKHKLFCSMIFMSNGFRYKVCGRTQQEESPQ